MMLKQMNFDKNDCVYWDEFDQEYLPTHFFNELYEKQEFDKRIHRRFFEPIYLTEEGQENFLKLINGDA